MWAISSALVKIPQRSSLQMPEQIAHVHLEDIGSNRVHQHLTPGKGVINFQSIFTPPWPKSAIRAG